MQQQVDSNEFTGSEAAEFLGVDLKNLAALLGRYGVGRHYVARYGDPFVYSREDLEKIKRDLGTHDGGTS